MRRSQGTSGLRLVASSSCAPREEMSTIRAGRNVFTLADNGFWGSTLGTARRSSIAYIPRKGLHDEYSGSTTLLPLAPAAAGFAITPAAGNERPPRGRCQSWQLQPRLRPGRTPGADRKGEHINGKPSTPSPALRLQGPRALDRRADDADPPRQDPPGLPGQPHKGH